MHGAILSAAEDDALTAGCWPLVRMAVGLRRYSTSEGGDGCTCHIVLVGLERIHYHFVHGLRTLIMKPTWYHPALASMLYYRGGRGSKRCLR